MPDDADIVAKCPMPSGPAPVTPVPESEAAAFVRYRLAFQHNADMPTLKSATALVEAWNDLAEAVGLNRNE